MWDNAQLVGAMVIFAEHRYYGDSIPTNASFNENPYLYLSVEQALADYAYLIEYFHKNATFTEQSPVVTFGGSYGGMLAAWFRQKYPHLTVG
jgi:lysosomal Pro-X carboxypeptidase